MAAFGRYELLRRVGSGGMADIWKARVEERGGVLKSVAIKRILPDLVEDREFLRMFADEATLVASLEHPNVVQVIEFGHVGKHDYFIAMEYVAGVNLARLLNRAFETSRLPPELALYVVFEATRGLGHAHTRTGPAGEPLGIVHRDVSPQNVLLSFAGDVKITDFGIARVQSAVPRTAAGHVRGKVAYMSPEQAAADPSRPVDPRSDLFSLGILLYEMMTGRRLFPGGSSIENHARVITFKEPSAQELEPVPPALREIVRTALQGNPDDRFQSAYELESALTAALGDDVFAQGKQFLASYLPRLFPDEWNAEKEEDAHLAPKTNVQISMADVDALPPKVAAPPPPPPPATVPPRRALPPRRRDEVSIDGGMIPEPVSRGDTVISERAPGELSLPRIPEPSVSVTVASEDLEHTRVRDDERNLDDESRSGLTLAPPIVPSLLPPPVEWVPQVERTVEPPTRDRGTRTGFDEPLFPARPPPPRWIAPAIVGGGALLVGLPFAILVVYLLWGMGAAKNETPAPVATPFAMRASPTPREAVTPVPPTPDATPDSIDEEMPIVEDVTPTPAPAPVRTAIAAVTRTPRPVTTPRATAPPVVTPTPEVAEVATGGRVRVEASTVCDVFVDRGKRAESTPFERELSAGRHTLGFVHKGTGLWLEQTYDVPAGGSLNLYVDVEQAVVKTR